MYQVKAQNGYEIQVIGKGENGLCRVIDRDYQTQYTGTYDECVAWLERRAVAIIS